LKGRIQCRYSQLRPQESDPTSSRFAIFLGKIIFFRVAQAPAFEPATTGPRATKAERKSWTLPLGAANDVRLPRTISHGRANDVIYVCHRHGIDCLAMTAAQQYPTAVDFKSVWRHGLPAIRYVAGGSTQHASNAPICDRKLISYVQISRLQPPPGMSREHIYATCGSPGGASARGSAVEDQIHRVWTTKLSIWKDAASPTTSYCLGFVIHYASPTGSSPVVPVGGSAAGSLAAYVLEITDLDPGIRLIFSLLKARNA